MNGIPKSIVFVWLLVMTSPTWAQGPTDPINRFSKAKAVARDQVYHDHTLTFYWKCMKKGRRCCEKTGVDDEARHMIYDLHNLVPSVGELNADRSNHPYGIVDEEPRLYGSCDFEVGGSPKVAEPAEALRGNVARIWLYMDETYGLSLSDAELVQFETWSQADPVGDWELERDGRIMNSQGNSNPFVAGMDEDE